MTILAALADLHKQATEERSHYYAGKVIREAAEEIIRLRFALKECSAPFDSGPGTVDQCRIVALSELQRRMNIAGEALDHD